MSHYQPPRYMVTDGHGHVLGWMDCSCGRGKEGTDPECLVCFRDTDYLRALLTEQANLKGMSGQERVRAPKKGAA